MHTTKSNRLPKTSKSNYSIKLRNTQSTTTTSQYSLLPHHHHTQTRTISFFFRSKQENDSQNIHNQSPTQRPVVLTNQLPTSNFSRLFQHTNQFMNATSSVLQNQTKGFLKTTSSKLQQKHCNPAIIDPEIDSVDSVTPVNHSKNDSTHKNHSNDFEISPVSVNISIAQTESKHEGFSPLPQFAQTNSKASDQISSTINSVKNKAVAITGQFSQMKGAFYNKNIHNVPTHLADLTSPNNFHDNQLPRSKLVHDADKALINVQAIIGNLFTSSSPPLSIPSSTLSAPSSSFPSSISSTSLATPTLSSTSSESSAPSKALHSNPIPLSTELCVIEDPHLRKLLEAEFIHFEENLLAAHSPPTLTPILLTPSPSQITSSRRDHTTSLEVCDSIPQNQLPSPQTSPLYPNLIQFPNPLTSFKSPEHIIDQSSTNITSNYVEDIQHKQQRDDQIHSALKNLKKNVSTLLTTYANRHSGIDHLHNTNSTSNIHTSFHGDDLSLKEHSQEHSQEHSKENSKENQPPSQTKKTKSNLASLQSLLDSTIDSIERAVVELPKTAAHKISNTTKAVTTTVSDTTKAVTTTVSNTTRTVTDTVATSISSTTNVVFGATTVVFDGIKYTIASIPSTTTNVLNFLSNTSLLQNTFNLKKLLPSLLSKTSTFLPVASTQAGIYTALMLFHRHHKLQSALNLPSLISQDLPSNLHTLTALGPILHQHAMVNYYNLFRSEQWVSKTTVIFLQRYLYIALSAYCKTETIALQIASKSGLDISLMHNSATIIIPSSSSSSTSTSSSSISSNNQSPISSSSSVPPSQSLSSISNIHSDSSSPPTSTLSTPPSPPNKANSSHTAALTSPSEEPSIPFAVEIPFLIFEDHTNGNFVVSIRGTNNLDDVITDLVSWPKQVGDSYVHSGMLAVAQKLLPRVLSALRTMLISKYLQEGVVSIQELNLQDQHQFEPPLVIPPTNSTDDVNNVNNTIITPKLTPEQLANWAFSFKNKPIPRIVFTGHSLGGGVSALMALICREMKEQMNARYFDSLLQEQQLVWKDHHKQSLQHSFDHSNNEANAKTTMNQENHPSTHTQKTTDADLVDESDEYQVHPASILGNNFDFIHQNYPTTDPFNNNLELAHLINPEVIVFASPALVSPQLSEKMKDYTITVISGDDPVPRLSEYSINNFIFEMIHNSIVRDPTDICASAPQSTPTSVPPSAPQSTPTSVPPSSFSASTDTDNKAHNPEIPNKTSPITTPPIQFSYPSKTQNIYNIPHSPLYHLLPQHQMEPQQESMFYVDHTGEFIEQRFIPEPSSQQKVPDDSSKSVYHHPLSGQPITQLSKPVPLYQSNSSPYIPSIGTVVDASLRFHRMVNPLSFLTNEIKRSAIGYGKGMVIGHTKKLAKGFVHQHLNQFGDETTHRSLKIRDISNKFKARTSQFKHHQKESKPEFDSDHLSSQFSDDLPFHEPPSSCHNAEEYHQQHLDAWNGIIEHESNDVDFSHFTINHINHPVQTHWNTMLHPEYMIQSPFQFTSSSVDSQHSEAASPPHSTIQSKPPIFSFFSTSNPTSSVLPTSLDQLATEFNDFFHTYKSTIQNNISPALFNLLANLPIAPKQPSRVVKQNPAVSAPTPNKSHPSSTCSTANPLPSSSSSSSKFNQHDPVAQNIEESIQQDIAETPEELSASTPLDAILPIPMTSEAFASSKTFLFPHNPRKLTREDTFYALKTNVYGMHSLDEFNNAICRMDVPGNLYYIKRIHKEVYLNVHLPVLASDSASDAEDGDAASLPTTNINAGFAPSASQSIDPLSLDQKRVSHTKSTPPLHLTTIASKVLQDQTRLSSKLSPENSSRLASVNNTDTWHINPNTGLLNIDTQAINTYKLQDNENWHNPSSYKSGFQHPSTLFNVDEYKSKKLQSHLLSGNATSFDNSSAAQSFNRAGSDFVSKKQGNELIQALISARDSPALPNITNLSTISSSKTSNPLQTSVDHISADQSNPEHILSLHSLHNSSQFRQRSELLIKIADNLTQAVASGGNSLLTIQKLQSLASYNSIQKQLEQFKQIQSQEYVRLFCSRAESNFEFSNLAITEHSLFDHFSKSYLAAFEDALADDSITISPQYSSTARSKLNYACTVEGTAAGIASSSGNQNNTDTGLKLQPQLIHIDQETSLRSLLASLAPDNTEQIQKTIKKQQEFILQSNQKTITKTALP